MNKDEIIQEAQRGAAHAVDEAKSHPTIAIALAAFLVGLLIGAWLF